MTAYLIVNYELVDQAGYDAYRAADPGTALGIPDTCQLLARDPNTTQLEGEGAGPRTVILQFDSVEIARTAYESEAYQAMLPHRLNASTRHFAILVDGDAPS